MLIKVEPRTLLGALKQVAPFTTTRYVMPILQAVKIAANDDNLTVSATDMDSGISYTVTDVEILREGVAVIPAKPLIHLLQNLDAYSEVELEAPKYWDGAGKVILKFPDGFYHIHAYDPEDYPATMFEVEGAGVAVSVSGSDLAQALKFASAFAGTQSYWQATDVVWLTLRDGELWVAGTDTHKLGLVRLPAPDPEGDLKTQIYLPVASASALATLCKTNPNITLRFNAQTLIVEGGQWQVRINGREVSPLNFDHVLSKPTERATTLMLSSVVPMLQFLQRVTPFDRRRHTHSVMPAAGMRIKVTATEQGLELEAVAKETYGANDGVVGRTQLPIEDFRGEPTVIWFNHRLLVETLQPFKPFKVQLGLETPNPPDLKPLIVTALETDPLTIMAYLMPLRFAPTETTDTDNDALESNGNDWDDADDANHNVNI